MKTFRPFLLLPAVICLSLFWSGCSDSPESLTADMIDKINETTEVLKTIDDRESAEAAKDDLEALADDFKDLEERYNDLDKEMTDEEKKEAGKMINEEYADDMRAALNGLQAEIMRIRRSSYSDEISQVLNSIKP